MPILSALLFAAALPAAPPALPANAATLVVYRAYAEPILFAPTLVIDDHEFGTLGQKRRLSFALAPGKHVIEAVWPAFSAQRNATLEVRAAPGQQLYVELQGAAAPMRRKGTSALVEQDAATGAAALACCRPPR
ncbi:MULTISPECIES: hypothetical protein [Sphingomonas]|uniref:hypothetical protein n=1 Tax=Sphingomonas TaxID=13687 RepID=UPI000DEF2AAB|nr:MULTISPECIES: hypothetical protein [Sphingomonas]